MWTSGRANTPAHHHAMDDGAVSVAAVFKWLLMLVAMMAPVLIPPIWFVRGSSLARRRTRSTLLFVAGYTTVWMCAGFVMLSISAALVSGFPPYGLIAAVFLVALVWQCSPVKQLCLNRCHTVYELAAFGRAADTDALIFGATHGAWCTGSCWAWMLFPLFVPSVHILAMVVTAVLIFCERLDDPAPLSWRLRGLGRARRIIAGQVRIACRRTWRTDVHAGKGSVGSKTPFEFPQSRA